MHCSKDSVNSRAGSRIPEARTCPDIGAVYCVERRNVETPDSAMNWQNPKGRSRIFVRD